MEKEKMNLQEATLKALYDQLDDSKDINEVEGLVDNILVVTDPKINTEEYEEVIERAQEIVEDTPEGEIPFDEEWEGQYLQTCPICGATFVTDEILEPGAICPVCTQVPEAFVMVGRVETDEQVAKENNIDTESENEEENIEGTEFKPETFEDEDEEIEEPNEEEKVEASEEVKSADNKLQENKDSFPDTFINSVKNGGYKPLKYCREAGDNSFEEKMSAKEIMDIYNNLRNIYSDLYSKNMTDKADEEELFNDIQYWEDRLKKLHENKEVKEEGFFNLYKDYKDLYGIDKYSPAELKKFINGLNDMNRISEKEYKIMTKFADDYQALIDNCGYESQLVEDVDILEEDKLNFKKYGIQRSPEHDFSDDGNRFRGYICNGVPMSYLKDDGEVYLSIQVGDLGGLNYEEYSKLPSYKDCDKYNGVDESSVDLADVAEICKRIKAEYDEALGNIKDISDDDYKAYTDKYLEKAKKEFEEAKHVIKNLEPEDLLNASEWDIKKIKRDLEYIKDEMNKWQWENKSKTNQTNRRYELGKESKEEYEKVNYWLDDLKELVEEIVSKRTESLHENKESDIKDIMEIVNEGKEVIEEATTKSLQDYVPEAIKNTNSAEEALKALDKLTTEELIRYVAILSIEFIYHSNEADLEEIEDFIRDYTSPEARYKFAKDQIEEDLENEHLSQKFNKVNESIKLQEESKADYDDLKALRTASDALQDLWDAIEGGESEFLGSYKSDIAEASDTIDNILKKAELSNMEAADIADEEIDGLIDELDESKKEESIDDEVTSFEKQLEKVGITTTNKLYFVTGTPEDCHTLEEADEYYELLPKWDSKNYWRDREDITEEQFELIDKNRKLAKEILKRASDNVNSYGPLD